jgi:imidazolonepropionase-like amidohydrolase
VLPMPLERAQAIVAEAQRLDRRVFAHPSNLAGVELALDSGVDVLAHVTSDDQAWSAELVERMRAYAAAGGEILFGTDVGYIYQFDTAEEYTIMARRLGFAGHSGRVPQGMDADLPVFPGTR